MKKINILFLLFMLPFGALHAQKFEWAKSFSGSNVDDAADVAVDLQGNVYTVGKFYQTCDLDPGAGVADSTSNGQSDAFIAKLDASGNFLWAKQIGGIGYDEARYIEFDGADIIVSGSFSNTVDFNPGAGDFTVTAALANEPFICKFNASGDFVWAKTIPGSGNHYIPMLAIDQSDNIYITSAFYGTVDIDPGVAVVNLSSGTEGMNGYLLKLTSAGTYVWAKIWGTAQYNYTLGIKIDGTGNIYVCGAYEGTQDFDPGVGTSNLTSTGEDAFVSKFLSTGAFAWVKKIGGTIKEGATDVAIDNAGNIFIVGYFSGTADFNPGAATFSMTSAGGYDAFIVKLNNLGNFSWAKKYGSTENQRADDISLDGAANMYISGDFSYTSDFDPGPGVFNLTSDISSAPVGVRDAYVSRLDSSGNFKYAFKVGGDGDNTGTSVIDGLGNLYVAGIFAGATDFDPGDLTHVITPASWDGYVVKINRCFGPSTPVISPVNPVCPGSSLNLSLTSGSLNDALEWKWYRETCGGSLVGTGATVSIEPTEDETYFIRAEGNCITAGLCAEVTVAVHLIPVVEYTEINATVEVDQPEFSLAAGTPSGGTYSGVGVVGNIFTPSIAGIGIHPVVYSYTDNNGCSNTASSEITVSDVEKVEMPLETFVSLYPNPAKGYLIVDSKFESFEMFVYNSEGILVSQDLISKTSTQIDLSGFSEGLYYFHARAVNQEKMQTGKFIIIR